MPDNEQPVEIGALVLYHGRPARVARVGDRLEIDLGGESQRVRAKDIQVLHPGPLAGLSELLPAPGDMRTAWEILAGSETTLAEIAELAYGRFTPATAWAAWQFVADGQYFNGTPDQLRAASVEELAEREAARIAQAAEERAWKEFLARAAHGVWQPGDDRYLPEIEMLAWGKSGRSRVLRELGRAETPESAHALLLAVGRWDERVNPHPRRLGVPLLPPSLAVPGLPEETRLDLTHLPAYAIDDEGNETPDDALSLDGERVWVHIADVSALVQPGSALDLEARGRAETLHLPEGHIHLFPPEMTHVLGLGLQAVSPALSFGIDLDADGGLADVQVSPSWVRVSRLTYAQATAMLESDSTLAGLESRMDVRRKRRIQAGAIDIDLPEVQVMVDESGEINIRPTLTLRGRRVVEEAMILTGEAAGFFAKSHGIPLLYNAQDAPENRVSHETLSGMFAMRRLMRRSQYRVTPGAHSGLGLPHYTQSTSPLRRYLDLVVHQQLRAFLRGEPVLSEGDLLERIGMVEAAIPALRQAEQASEKHWTLVYLRRHTDWQGQAVLVERRGTQGIWLVPELALEARASIPPGAELDAEFPVHIQGIDLPRLEFAIKIA
jgi:exoribonuclease-2